MIRILDFRLIRADLTTRMPFRFGISTMTALPHVFLLAQWEIDGVLQSGIAADHLPPKWFTKDPARGLAAEVDEMLTVIAHAQADAVAVGGAESPFAFWRQLWGRSEAWIRASGLPPLLVHFGTSLVERTLIDAFCHRRDQPLADALRQNSFGIDLGWIHPGLAGSQPGDWLLAPASEVFARHTVGLSDPLTEAEIPAEGRLADGLPQSLEACIRTYGLRHFKLKIGQGDDLGRLRAIAAVMERCAPADFACSLDGNENFHDVAAFREFWERFCGDPVLAGLRDRLLFVEQPFHRSIALAPEIGALVTWALRPPIVIDESDDRLDSLSRALALGYVGTTHKNCKGVFKGVANACLLAQRRRAEPTGAWSYSGEDLSTIGPVALLQDLAVQGALGVSTVERNGHHYFAGLSMWPAAVGREVLQHHPDLYCSSARGWPTLRIEAGRLSLRSVLAAPFGVGFDAAPQISQLPV